MIYDFKCIECENIQEGECSYKIYKEFHPACTKCGALCNYQWTPTVIQFALKDGPSGSYPSKGERIKKDRAKASERATIRQRDRYGDMKAKTAVPNFNGQETESWREAQQIALKEKGADSAATYAPKVEAEKKIII